MRTTARRPGARHGGSDDNDGGLWVPDDVGAGGVHQSSAAHAPALRVRHSPRLAEGSMMATTATHLLARHPAPSRGAREVNGDWLEPRERGSGGAL